MKNDSRMVEFAAGIHSQRRCRRSLARGALLSCSFILATLSSQVIASESDDAGQRYHIAYQGDAIGSKLIAEGEFSAAVDQIESGLALHDRYEWHTNLCVALISQGDYERAGLPCRAAVRYSKVTFGSYGSRPSERKALKSRQSTAWNNLGVLQALQGEQSEARQSFARAQKRGPRYAVMAGENLATLEQRNGGMELANAVTVSMITR